MIAQSGFDEDVVVHADPKSDFTDILYTVRMNGVFNSAFTSSGKNPHGIMTARWTLQSAACSLFVLISHRKSAD